MPNGNQKKVVTKNQMQDWTKIVSDPALETISKRIRALNAAGVERADIARFLSIFEQKEKGRKGVVIYQQVRNTLENAIGK